MNRVRDGEAAEPSESSHRLKVRPSGLRLWLLEGLLACEQREAVVALGAAWTSDSLGGAPALCLLTGGVDSAVVQVAGLRSETTRSELCAWLARDDVQALLREARERDVATTLSAREARALAVPDGFARRGLWMAALRSPDASHGLIVCGEPSGDRDDELLWAARHLGTWLARLHAPAPPAARPVSEDSSTLRSVAGVVHELRAPLASVLGHSSMLLQGFAGELSPEQRRMLQRIDSSGRHALALVSDLLDLARLEARQIVLEQAWFSAFELLSEVAGEMAPLAQPSVKLVVEFSGSSPRMLSDRMRLKQILVNLVSNALKFTSAGHVRICAALSSSQIVFSVCDTGLGICQDDLSIIFEPFSQVSSSRHKGTGLGLAISRELSQLLDAKLSVESVLGQGSTFSLRLPAASPR